MGAAAFGLFIGGAGAYLVYVIVDGLRAGTVRGRFRNYPRSTQPVFYWTYVVLYSITAAMLLATSPLFFRAAWLGCSLRSTIHTCNVLQGFF